MVSASVVAAPVEAPAPLPLLLPVSCLLTYAGTAPATQVHPTGRPVPVLVYPVCSAVSSPVVSSGLSPVGVSTRSAYRNFVPYNTFIARSWDAVADQV